jgi:parallel beta-helix repeat protein
VGVLVDGHAGVTITGGTIASFFRAGVSLQESANGVVRRLRVTDIGAGGVEGQPSAGVFVQASPGTRILDSSVRNDVKAFQSDGVVVLSSPGTVVRRNQLERNAWNGLVLIESPRSRVVGNKLGRNGNNGLEVNGDSDGAVVAGNRAPGNAQVGLVVGASRDVRVFGNEVWGNAGPGVLLFDLIDGLVARNDARKNGVGIVLAAGQHGSHGNRVVRNRAVRNDEDGIVVEEEEAGTAAGNTLARNVANRNGGHGIAAVKGTIDGGGNRAHGNRTPPDCIAVTCS